MVGSGSVDRSKEAVGMMALHEALRTVCLNSDWTYSVFWTIRPRPRVRGGNGCKVGDDNGSMLMWEDGFCKGRVTTECLEEIEGEDPVRKAFSKMSIQLYNYGEGWLPPEWTDQFDSGIQTIAVIQAGHGLLQLGSCKISSFSKCNFWVFFDFSWLVFVIEVWSFDLIEISVNPQIHEDLLLNLLNIPEDLHFVLRMRHTFESLGYQSGFYLSQLFSSNRNGPSLSTISSKQAAVPTRPPPLFNWNQRPLPPATNPMLASPNFQNPARLGFPQPKDETHMFLLPRSSETRMEDMMVEHENDIKWPNGLSFFSALTGRTEDAKLLFNSESLGNKSETNHHSLILEGKDSNHNTDVGTNPNKFLSLDSHPDNTRMKNKF
ncbi:hypothetical protein GOBAR_AA32734 [Gossypium barbadense]|uniref:Transcription factor MYC/MYB N-terminal domain-containing protein n=1 Tax=Gossypium barbadense TaxID=3634 RepID=A0A2P5WA44_GOSBA|nr:hypothetical protein GOBAR_AA32734 [Gossypium barbadense]